MKYLLFPFRCLQSVIAIFVIAGVALVCMIPFFIFAKCSKQGMFAIQKLWSWAFVTVCGGRLTVTGQENIPSTGAVYLFNHSSFLDIPVLVLGTNKFVNYVAKKELGMIPVVGWCIRAAGTLMMPRKNFEASIALYEKAKARLAAGEQFMVAPEGTRNRQREGMGPFKSGPFYFAMSCQADLVPVILWGTQDLWPPEDLVPNLRKMTGRIHMHICPKMSTQDWTDENRKAKMEELRRYFEEQLKNPPH
ncbi:MAG: 1-acyl-sn-glycerol-3-phosphate acyltransferase [Bdellovibrionaceae bacterium]|nr:1-acyl-sn-glycerol-3-phosphate acyltransferase [Pseudobdellovibrionaceae bacterium]